jgi:hypothetical protein
MEADGSAPWRRDDFPTLAAIGVLAYVFCDIGHELVGHGGACILSGGRAISLSTVHFQCFGGAQRLVSAAGILFNIAVGAFCGASLRFVGSGSIHTRYLLWLAAAYNTFTGFGYVVSSAVRGSGDLANAAVGLAPVWHWRLAAAILGALLYMAAVWRATLGLREYIGPGGSARVWRLILVPYFSAAIAAVAAGSCNSILKTSQVLLMAVDTTLGVWGFLLIPAVWRWIGPPKAAVASQPPLTRSLAHILMAVIVIIIFVAVVGPGLRIAAGVR